MEKFTTADRGNGLRAVAPLRPGELLFRSDPLAYTVCKGSRGVVCDRCLLGYVRRGVCGSGPLGVVSVGYVQHRRLQQDLGGASGEDGGEALGSR